MAQKKKVVTKKVVPARRKRTAVKKTTQSNTPSQFVAVMVYAVTLLSLAFLMTTISRYLYS
jgi:hypothetical protein